MPSVEAVEALGEKFTIRLGRIAQFLFERLQPCRTCFERLTQTRLQCSHQQSAQLCLRSEQLAAVAGLGDSFDRPKLAQKTDPLTDRPFTQV